MVRVFHLADLIVIVDHVREVAHLLPTHVAIGEHRATCGVELIVLHVTSGLLILRLVSRCPVFLLAITDARGVLVIWCFGIAEFRAEHI